VTAPSAWQPCADGALAERSLEAVQAIADELRQAPGWLPDDLSAETTAVLRASLAAGRAGQALLYAYLSFTGHGEDHADRALELLDEATDAVAATPMTDSLYSGFPGIAWVTDHLRDRLFTDEEEGREVDEALLAGLSRSLWRGEYDLINGLTGIGVYALEGLPRPTAAACLERVVKHLAERAEEASDGVAWFSPPETLPDYQSAAYPAGLYNLGVSHGAAGVVALLGAACRAGLAAAGPLLERAVPWLLARRQGPEADFCFPHFHAPGSASQPSRLAWCYGDAGIAAALWIAARAAGEPSWEQAARDIAAAAAARPLESTRVQDAGLCHGAAGLAHIFGRLAWEMGDERLAAAARLWLERTLAYRTPGQGAGGFRSWAAGLTGPQEWRDDRGFLEGAAGVGLALLAATSTVEPEWDRVLLVSAR
jgi:lantibiotic modifying enzyme